MKTVREAITEKLSKDPNTKVATSQERQANPDRKSSGALTSEVTSVTEPLQTPPKRETTRKSRLTDTKQEKIDPDQERELPPRLDRFEPMETKETKVSTCQARKNADEHQSERWKPRKHIQNALKNKVAYKNQ